MGAPSFGRNLSTYPLRVGHPITEKQRARLIRREFALLNRLQRLLHRFPPLRPSKPSRGPRVLPGGPHTK